MIDLDAVAIRSCDTLLAVQNDHSSPDNECCIVAVSRHLGSVSVVGSDAASGATGSGVGGEIWR